MTLLLFAQLSLQDCKNDTITTDCNGHGTCLTNEADNTTYCECNVPWVDSSIFCTDCEEEGFILSDDGIRCVNINSCTNKAAGDLTECTNNHGFCEHINENDSSDSNYYCRCRRHYSNETTGLKKEPSYCSNCESEHYETYDKTACVPEACIANFSRLNTTDVTSCSDYGLCFDLTDGNPIHEIEIDVILDIINKILDNIGIPIELESQMCICKTPHMTEKCEGCAPGYTQTEIEEATFISFKCYQNDCYDYDADFNPLGPECNNAGTCLLNSQNIYTCNCTQPNYDSSTICTTCTHSFDLSTNCTECLPGWDIKTLCSACSFGFDSQSNCTECLEGFQMSEDGLCNQCEHNMDPLTRCTSCPEGLSVNSNGDCAMQTSSGDTTAIVFGCILGAIVLIVLIVILIKYLQKRREKNINYDQIAREEEQKIDIDQQIDDPSDDQ